MSGTLLCVIAFFSCLLSAVWNWRHGLCVMIAWGYFFGILKAHYVGSWGHFIFDAATVGFYFGIILNPPAKYLQACWREVAPWAIVLSAWPIFMTIVPIQHYLVQIVGLRANIFWVPMLLIGAMLDRAASKNLSLTFGVLNIVSFGFALAEYNYGVGMFVPENEVTKIVFHSNDIAGGYTRIPSIFTNAHTYAGTMVATIPWLILGFLDRENKNLTNWYKKAILVSGLTLGILGIFVAGPRSPIVILSLTIGFVIFSGRINFGLLFVLICIGTVVMYFVSQNERMQRFAELQDLEMVSDRLSVSLNSSFIDVIFNYPMGVGMGAGGTSLPFFAESLVTGSVYIENEYARILLEQGLPGLLIFLAFVSWFLTKQISKNDEFLLAKNLIWFYTAIMFATSWIGIGMMSSVPATAMFFLGIGFCLNPAKREGVWFRLSNNNKIHFDRPSFIPAYQRGLGRN